MHVHKIVTWHLIGCSLQVSDIHTLWSTQDISLGF